MLRLGSVWLARALALLLCGSPPQALALPTTGCVLGEPLLLKYTRGSVVGGPGPMGQPFIWAALILLQGGGDRDDHQPKVICSPRMAGTDCPSPLSWALSALSHSVPPWLSL